MRISSVVLLGLVLGFASVSRAAAEPLLIDLPAPRWESLLSVESALVARRSHRSFAATPLQLSDVAQLLWAAQGVTDERGRRTAPSAGALYPLTVFLCAADVEGIEAGSYVYRPDDHGLEFIDRGDCAPALAAATGQSWVGKGAAILVVAADFEKTAARYGNRAAGYVHIEVGHVGQNVYLQAEALGLGTTIVGALDEAAAAAVFDMSGRLTPIVVMPVGAIFPL